MAALFRHKSPLDTLIDLAIALVVFVSVFLRFYRIDLIPFINDEPALQLLLDQYVTNGRIPLTGLVGSQPIPYGPVPLWIYSLMRSCYSDFYGMAYIYVSIQTLALCLYAALFLKIYGWQRARIMWLLIFTSPYLFFYGRLIWDNSFLIFFSGVALWCLYGTTRLPDVALPVWNRGLCAVGLGASLGFGLATHLMFLPFVFAVLISLFMSWGYQQLRPHVNRPSLNLLPTLLVGVTAVIVLLPYLVGVTSLLMASKLHGVGDSSSSLSPNFSLLYPILMRSFYYWNFNRFLYAFFSDDMKQENGTFSSSMLMWDRAGVLGYILMVLALGGLIYRIFWAKEDVEPGERWLEKLALFLLGGVLIFYCVTGHFRYPHYYNYVWWVYVVAMGASMAVPQLRHMCVMGGLLVAFVNVTGIVRLGHYIHKNSGSRSRSIGTTAGEQMRAIKGVCQELKKENPVRARLDTSATNLFNHSIVYFASLEPECRGVSFESEGGDATIAIQYSEPIPSAKLTWRMQYHR